MSEPPKSSSILNNMFLTVAAKHPKLAGKLFRKGFTTAVVAQMLPEGSFLKGGSALALRYPLEEARNSRDVDSVFTTSKEHFLTEFNHNLREGWQGFTGTCEVQERKRYPEGVDLQTLTVTLDYKGKRFAKVDFEATPDIEGQSSNTVRALDANNTALFSELGFSMQPPLMVSLEDQLADKLNALSDPDKRRGKDLRDVEIMMQHGTPNLHKLRVAIRASERVPNGHEVHVLDTNMDEYLDGYSQARGENIEHAWSLANALLEQVDCDCAHLWKDAWGDMGPSNKPDLQQQAMEEAQVTRDFLTSQIPLPPLVPSSPNGPVHVSSYRRKDGTIVRGHTRRR